MRNLEKVPIMEEIITRKLCQKWNIPVFDNTCRPVLHSWVELVQMACLQALKQDIKTLESIFTPENERFRIVSASVDEVSCQFVGADEETYNIHSNITVRTIPLLLIASLELKWPSKERADKLVTRRGTRTHDIPNTNRTALPTELVRLMFYPCRNTLQLYYGWVKISRF